MHPEEKTKHTTLSGVWEAYWNGTSKMEKGKEELEEKGETGENEKTLLKG